MGLAGRATEIVASAVVVGEWGSGVGDALVAHHWAEKAHRVALHADGIPRHNEAIFERRTDFALVLTVCATVIEFPAIDDAERRRTVENTHVAGDGAGVVRALAVDKPDIGLNGVVVVIIVVMVAVVSVDMSLRTNSLCRSRPVMAMVSDFLFMVTVFSVNMSTNIGELEVLIRDQPAVSPSD